ncbi:MAG: tryptophan synthase subunit alpha [Spirochaetes bacterium]|nr:tryptophan synthase subunit alpha [Spirochaetota bacterium]MBX3721929.1 tryptophan synthase subunit alpha [Turneriella sp.]
MHPMTRLLHERKKQKGYLFIPYIAYGDPDAKITFEIICKMVEGGAATVEIGLPFTDPVADGPTLERAFRRSLKHEFKMTEVFSMLGKLHRKYPKFPFTIMGYANIFYQAGFRTLLEKFYDLGVQAVIIPDIPFDEKKYIIEKEGLADVLTRVAWIDFITPTTTVKRMQEITREANGFVYLVSYKGVTGQKNFTLKPLKPLIKSIRKATRVPLVVGFGIKDKMHASEAVRLTDGFIMGTVFHEMIEHNIERAPAIPHEIGWALPNMLP